jgi:excisionase family DNA binding protein
MSSGSNHSKTEIAAQPDCLLTVAEAAQLLRLKNVNSMYQLVSQRRVPVIKLSARCIRFSRNALLRWLEELSQPAE